MARKSFRTSANLVYADYAGQVDEAIFKREGYLGQRFPSFDFSLVRNNAKLHESVGAINRNHMPFFWLSGDVHGYKKLGANFLERSLERIMLICEEPFDMSHVQIGLESNSPFFGSLNNQDSVQNECWDYFCNLTGCKKPSTEGIENGNYRIRAIHVPNKRTPEKIGDVIESAYVLHLERVIDDETSRQRSAVARHGRVVCGTHHLATVSGVVVQGFPSLSDTAQVKMVKKLRQDFPQCNVIELEDNQYSLDIGLGIGVDEEKFDYVPKVEGFNGLYKRVKK